MKIVQMYASLEAMAAGLAANPPAGVTSLAVGGKAMTVAEMAALCREQAAPQRDVIDLTQRRNVALDVRDKAVPEARVNHDRVRAALKGALGPSNPELRIYGIEPEREAQPLTTVAQAKRNAKALATRKARGTMGRRQKLAIQAPEPTTAEPLTPVLAPLGE